MPVVVALLAAAGSVNSMQGSAEGSRCKLLTGPCAILCAGAAPPQRTALAVYGQQHVLHLVPSCPQRCQLLRCYAEDGSAPDTTAEASTKDSEAAAAEPSSNGAAADVSSSDSASAEGEAPTILNYKPLSGGQLFWARARMALAAPRRRVKKGSYLVIKLEGAVISAV